MPHPYAIDDATDSFVTVAATIARDVASRHAADVDVKGRFPKETVEALGRAGLLGLTVPKDLGGKGQGPRAFCGVVEELAKACPSSAMVYVMHVTASQPIAASSSGRRPGAG